MLSSFFITQTGSTGKNILFKHIIKAHSKKQLISELKLHNLSVSTKDDVKHSSLSHPRLVLQLKYYGT